MDNLWTACATFTYLHSNASTQYSIGCQPLGGHMFWACLGVYVGYNSWMYIYIYTYDKGYIDILREYSWYMINMCVYHTCRYIWFVSIYTHACGWSKNIWIYIKYIELLMMPIGPTSLGPKLCVKTCPFCGRIYLYVFLFQIQSKVRAIEESDADSKKHSLYDLIGDAKGFRNLTFMVFGSPGYL